MAQRAETDLREITDLIKGLGSKIENLDQRFVETDKKIEALDKKMDLKFAETDANIQALDRKMDLKFAETDANIQVLDKKMDLKFAETDANIQVLDKKMDLKFAETDAKIQALSKTTELSFAEVNGKLDLVNGRLTGLDEKLKTSDTNIMKLDNRIWAFGGFALTVSVGSLLTVFIRFMFTNSPKF